VNNWPADNPYLRAVADTSRGALALSATIRRFSSGVQRRRAPVWITSSRDTFDIVVCSVIRLCLRGFIPQRKAAIAGGLPNSGPVSPSATSVQQSCFTLLQRKGWYYCASMEARIEPHDGKVGKCTSTRLEVGLEWAMMGKCLISRKKSVPPTHV
jgi:hypothetical protein